MTLLSAVIFGVWLLTAALHSFTHAAGATGRAGGHECNAAIALGLRVRFPIEPTLRMSDLDRTIREVGIRWQYTQQGEEVAVQLDSAADLPKIATEVTIKGFGAQDCELVVAPVNILLSEKSTMSRR